MSSTILCAIDVSEPEHDRKVLRIAAKLAQMDGAQLDIITVVPDFGMSVVGQFFDQDFHDKAVEKARALLNDFAVEVIGEEANRAVRHIVATGKAYEEILHAAHEAGSDLIVIGAQKPHLRDYLLGPNSSRVVRHSDCSVYVVRLTS